MKLNMGNLDRSIRVLIAVVIGILYYLSYITGTWAIILLVLAVILVLTSAVGTCPLYLPFKFTTRKTNLDEG